MPSLSPEISSSGESSLCFQLNFPSSVLIPWRVDQRGTSFAKPSEACGKKMKYKTLVYFQIS
jgi:hypothetical protein